MISNLTKSILKIIYHGKVGSIPEIQGGLASENPLM